MIEVGDKFIIEIDQVITMNSGKKYYVIKDSLLTLSREDLKRYASYDNELNNELGKISQQMYARGWKEGYHAGRNDNGEIKIGDEVHVTTRKANDGDELIFTVTRIINDNILHGVNKNGTIHIYTKREVEKTGRHYDEVAALLKHIGDDNEKCNGSL